MQERPARAALTGVAWLASSARNARKHAQPVRRRKMVEYKFCESHVFSLLSGMSSWQGKLIASDA
jgi:hypothetical protein